MISTLSTIAFLVVTGGVPAEDPLSEKLRHCPTTVEHARTEIRDVPSGVELTITASEAAGALEVRRRAKHLEAFTRASERDRAGTHGKGSGGGFMRECPVITKDTLVTAEDVPGGARILVVPKAKETVALVRADVRARQDALVKRLGAPEKR